MPSIKEGKQFHLKTPSACKPRSPRANTANVSSKNSRIFGILGIDSILDEDKIGGYKTVVTT